MTDNNGKALREAKAKLNLAARLRAVARKFGMAYDDLDAIEKAVALVEAVEAAPVVAITECNQVPGASDFDFGDMTAAVQKFKPGQRVRVLAVGEDG